MTRRSLKSSVHLPRVKRLNANAATGNSRRYSLLWLALATSLASFGSVAASNQSSAAVSSPAAASTLPLTDVQRWPALTPALPADAALEQRLEKILAGMTLKQKIAQMIQPEIRDITVQDMREYGFGSYLNGGGSFPQNNKHATPQDWIALAEAMYQASVDDSVDGSRIPTMWGTDAVHGHNNVIGATIFPHNIGLGAARDPLLIEQIARATAVEVRATGIDWIFAPTVAVPQDDRWGRTYEGYAEEPALVRDYAAAIVRGLQGEPGKDFLTEHHVIATVKHFIGDGGTVGGVDQGDNIASEQTLIDTHAQGYVGGLGAGAQTVMASFNSWHGVKNHGNPYLLTEVLKKRLAFDGLVVGDWNGHGQIPGCSNENCAQAALAGLDVYMVPTSAWKPLFHNLLQQAETGVIPASRIDDAVRRILRVKLRAGLFDRPGPAKRAYSGKLALIGAAEHRAIAAQAVRKSLVLLKNNNDLLPLSPTSRILLTGPAADDIGLQSGGWTISWQGTGNTNSDFPGGSSVYQGFAAQVKAAGGSIELSKDGRYQQKPDVAVVVFGEEPYAEGNGDIDNLEFQRGNKVALAQLKQLKDAGIPVVSVFFSGRPLWVNPELNQSDAFVAAWLPGSEGAAIADVLLKSKDGHIQHDFHGKLSFSWPASPTDFAVGRHSNVAPLLPYGYGLGYQQTDDASEQAAAIVAKALPEQLAGRDQASSSLPLFERAAKAPWQFFLQSQGQQVLVSSNVQQVSGLKFASVDRKVQEDARALQFDGKARSAVALGSNFPRDLRAYASQGVLQFALKLQSGQAAAIRVGLGCEGDNCRQLLPLPASALLASQQNQWQTVELPLSCFDQINFAKVQQSFILQSDQAVSLQLADIRLLPAASTATASRCPAP